MPKTAKDRDASAGLDALYGSDDFRMYCFKVLPCSKHYSHDWTVCPFAHPGEKARRRDPRVFRYAGVECPHVKEGLKCPRGDLCPFAHNIFECWLHPTRYRTQLCNEPASCRRKVCFFAHTLEELRDPSSPLDANAKDTTSSKGSRMSVDSGCSTPFNAGGSSCPSRQSVDFPVSPQPAVTMQAPNLTGNLQLPIELPSALNSLNQAAGSNITMNDLVATLQHLTTSMGSQQLPQSDRIVQLLLMLLGEISSANQAAENNGSAQSPLPRMSADGHRLARGPRMNLGFASNGLQWGTDGANLLVNQANIQDQMLKGQLDRMSMDTLMRPYNMATHGRGPSIDAVGAAAVSEAMSMGFAGAGRVSVDGSLLTGLHTAQAGPAPSTMHCTSNFLNAGRVGPGVPLSAPIIAENGGLRKSSDSAESEDTQMRQSTDANLADVFILH